MPFWDIFVKSAPKPADIKELMIWSGSTSASISKQLGVLPEVFACTDLIYRHIARMPLTLDEAEPDRARQTEMAALIENAGESTLAQALAVGAIDYLYRGYAAFAVERGTRRQIVRLIPLTGRMVQPRSGNRDDFGRNTYKWQVNGQEWPDDKLLIVPNFTWVGMDKAGWGLNDVLSDDVLAFLNASATERKALTEATLPSGFLFAEKSNGTVRDQELQQHVNTELSKNGGKLIVLTGGWKYQAANSTAADIFSTTDRDQWRQLRICMAHGVPPEILGLGQKTYSNYIQARAGFYTECLIPLVETMLSAINRQWVV